MFIDSEFSSATNNLEQWVISNRFRKRDRRYAKAPRTLAAGSDTCHLRLFLHIATNRAPHPQALAPYIETSLAIESY